MSPNTQFYPFIPAEGHRELKSIQKTKSERLVGTNARFKVSSCWDVDGMNSGAVSEPRPFSKPLHPTVSVPPDVALPLISFFTQVLLLLLLLHFELN